MPPRNDIDMLLTRVRFLRTMRMRFMRREMERERMTERVELQLGTDSASEIDISVASNNQINLNGEDSGETFFPILSSEEVITINI